MFAYIHDKMSTMTEKAEMRVRDAGSIARPCCYGCFNPATMQSETLFSTNTRDDAFNDEGG